jgi:lipopolysaccharide export system protein LptA
MRRLNNILCGLMCLLLSPLAIAKTSDAQQPIYIEADQVEIRDQDGISIYRGHVRITRGSLRISGDQVRLHRADKGVERISVDGQPAELHQLNDADEEITAIAYHMDYEAGSGLLTLEKQAELIRHNNRFTSEHIVYDTNKDIVQAGQPQQPVANGPKPRVTITIMPDPPAADTRKKTE